VDYYFYDSSGNSLLVDTQTSDGAPVASDREVSFVLAANQPSEVRMLKATGSASDDSSTTRGSVWAAFFCPDPATCQAVQPQLIFSASPTYPWSETVRIVWDGNEWTQWSTVGIDDGQTNLDPQTRRNVSLAIYNESSVTSSFAVRVYDSNGNLVGGGTTPPIAGANSNTMQGGTFGALLEDVVHSPLPAGPIKVLVDGGRVSCIVQAFQFAGQSATNMQVSYDYAPGTAFPLLNATKSAKRSRTSTSRSWPAPDE
jgi:hypothetical protein